MQTNVLRFCSITFKPYIHKEDLTDQIFKFEIFGSEKYLTFLGELTFPYSKVSHSMLEHVLEIKENFIRIPSKILEIFNTDKFTTIFKTVLAVIQTTLVKIVLFHDEAIEKKSY